MKTNCELPLCMLNESVYINQFELVLFHLIKESEEYRNWAFSLRKNRPDRIMILDNSGYEFFVKGETLNLAEYAQCVEALRPNYYILPDILGNKKQTLDGVREFLTKYPIQDRDIHPMAVVQGKSERDLLDCMREYKKMGISSICIPFHLKAFRDRNYNSNILNTFYDKYGFDSDFMLSEDVDYAVGRVDFILKNQAFINHMFSYVHLLGSHCPLEKVFYVAPRNPNSGISSMDTGYPVKLGVKGLAMFEETGKPNTIIDDFFKEDLPEPIKNQISLNVIKFRDMYD